MSTSIAAVCGVRLREYALRSGIDPALVPPLAVPSADLLEARVPLEDVNRLWEAVMRACQDPAFPVRAGASSTAHDYDAVGFACMTQPTLGEAIHQVVRYARVWTDQSEWAVERDERTVRMIFTCPDPMRLAIRVTTENILAEMMNAGRKLTGVEYAAAAVRFRHPAPRDTSFHEAFFGCPVEWSAPRNELALTAELARLPLPKADPALAAFFDRHVQRLLSREPDDVELVSGRVRALVVEEIRRGTPTLQTAAAHLAMSPRTLKRRLQEENTTFQDIVDAVRCDLAKRYLGEPRMPLGEVSFLLGFSEPSAFHRAFKRWTGQTPLAFRTAAA
ncbi:MAG: AraC family transcriptional regulator [Polyangiaceae bacterium]